MPARDVTVDLDIARFLNTLGDHLFPRMDRVGLMLEGGIKQDLSRGNVTGASPSAPGEPPKAVTGTLRSHISHTTSRDGSDIVTVVGVTRGPATAYAERLEKGTENMAARPFLRPGVANRRQQILAMLGG